MPLSLAAGFFCATATFADPPTFQDVFTKVIDQKCTRCHGQFKVKKGVRLLTYDEVMKLVDLSDPLKSELIAITENDTMPDWPVEPLTDDQKGILRDWILAGAPNN